MSDHQDGAWDFESVQTLRKLVQGGQPVSVISLKLKRSAESIHSKISELGLTPVAEV